MAIVLAGGALVVFDARVIVRVHEAGQAVAAIRAGRVDAQRIRPALVSVRSAFYLALVNICASSPKPNRRAKQITIDGYR